MSSPASTSRIPEWVRGYLSRYRKQVVLAIALGVISFGCSAFLMFASGYLISRTAQAGVTLFMVMLPVAFVQVFGLGRPFARYFERLISHDWVFRITSDLRLKLFGAIDERASIPSLQKSTGEYLGLLDDDIGHLQNLYLRVVFPTVIAFALFVGASVVFGIFSFELLATMLIAGIATAVILPFASLTATRAVQARVKALRSAEYDSLTDDILGASDWALANRSGEVVAAHLALDDAIRADEQKTRRILRILELVSTFVLLAGITATLVIAGSHYAGSEATANWIAALVLGFFPLIEVFAVLPAATADSTTHIDAIRRLDNYITIEPKADRQPARTDDVPVANEAKALSIEIEHVTYTYPAAKSPALTDLSLSIEAGQKAAVLGRSGSGKSTLAALVRGALPFDDGIIRLGTTAITDPGLSIPSTIGYISQNPYLFDSTLRENLRFANMSATDEQLVAVLESVGLANVYSQMERGLDTVIGETGRKFSGGESQRISLARVLLADTPIVLLDEPFTALDPNTEHKLMETIFETCAGKTLVVITHHLMDIERFDRVVFIEDGCIEIDGAPHSLAAENPRYQQLLAFDRATY